MVSQSSLNEGEPQRLLEMVREQLKQLSPAEWVALAIGIMTAASAATFPADFEPSNQVEAARPLLTFFSSIGLSAYAAYWFTSSQERAGVGDKE